MVTASQLQIVQSPITALISSISTSVNVKLDDSNYLNWHFQIQLLLESNGIMGFVDGSHPCPPQFSDQSGASGMNSSSNASVATDEFMIWKMHDKAVMQLLTATLSPAALSCAIGSKSSQDIWIRLKEQFSTVSKTSIFQMKSNLQTIKKGSDSVSQYLHRIKEARDYLSATGVHFADEDIVILALNGLPSEYNTFRCVIRGRENAISLKEFQSQLLAEEIIVENSTTAPFITAMVANNVSHSGKGASGQSQFFFGGYKRFNGNRNKGPNFVGAPSQFYPSQLHSSNFGAPGYNVSSQHSAMNGHQFSLQAMHTVMPQSPSVASPSHSNPQVWLTDSGATNHMTSDLSNLSLASPYPTSEIVQTANGEGLPVSHIGSTVLNLSNVNYVPPIKLNSVLYVPKTRPHGGSFTKEYAVMVYTHFPVFQPLLMDPPQYRSKLKLFSTCWSIIPHHTLVLPPTVQYLLFPLIMLWSLCLMPHNITITSCLFQFAWFSYHITLSDFIITTILSVHYCLYYFQPPVALVNGSPQSQVPEVQFHPDTLSVESEGTNLSLIEPTSYKSTLKNPIWFKAMQEEISALHTQGTWNLVVLPSLKNLVGCKWIFKIKRHSNGTIARHKARLVAKGFSQEPGIDYGETFSPVVKPTTVRLVLTLAAQFGWSLRQLDVKNAFLHGILEDEVYMAQPPGFEDVHHPHLVCKLQKSLYGLKQAPRAWNDRFTKFLPHLGFQTTYSDSSLFVKTVDSGIVILLLYVDDIIITGSASASIQQVITALHTEFDIKDLRDLHYFLGIQISRTPTGLFLSQSKYVLDLLTKTEMLDAKPCDTPCLPYNRLLKDDGDPYTNPTLYRSVVGALQYLTFTRPDIAFSVHQVAQFMQSPMVAHFTAVKRILRYLKETLSHDIGYSRGSLQLKAFSDADWAGDPNDRRSTTGLVVFLGNSPISWSSKKQLTVPLSSTPVLFCDNMSAIALSFNPVQHQRTKHIEIDVHFVRERVAKKHLSVQFVSSKEQFADILTKGLSSPLFHIHCSNLMLRASQPEFAGG
ncbi:uncharacterized protein [Malus domestica]|uniref:uncharacterized protein n=1 Tax=Malus domestica TaxID=3750 RepID=UPI003975142B